jgi:hypothetical protein
VSTLVASLGTLRRGSALRAFSRHYLEMVVAMVLGMVLLGPAEAQLLDMLGRPDLLGGTEVGMLVMATNMTIAMALWMRVRGHRWAPVAEMSAAMYVPFLVLFVPLWLGALSAHGLMLWGHVLMLPAMALAMLLRVDEYTGHCGHA